MPVLGRRSEKGDWLCRRPKAEHVPVPIFAGARIDREKGTGTFAFCCALRAAQGATEPVPFFLRSASRDDKQRAVRHDIEHEYAYLEEQHTRVVNRVELLNG